MRNSTDFSTVNRLRLNSMLRDRGLDKPLDDYELTLQLLDTELRLEQTESILNQIVDVLQGHNIHLDNDVEDIELSY